MTQPQLLALQPFLTVAIFIQSLAAMVGSLYYSTFGDPVANLAAKNLFPVGNGFTPCELCWYARILMYPIVFISYMALATNDRRYSKYVLILAGLGIPLEMYHYAIQKLPIQTFFTCSSANPCNALQVNYFEFITIPLLCLTAFVVIFVLAMINEYINRRAATSDSK